MGNRNLSLVTLRESKQLVDYIKKRIQEYQDVFTIKILDEESILIRVIDSEPKSNFHFTVTHGSIRGQSTNMKNYFSISSSPGNDYSKAETQALYHIKGAEDFFHKWSNDIKEYNSIILDQDPILKAYEEEFYSEYKILDKDADVKPFSRQQQQQLHLFLGHMGSALQQKTDNDETIAPIITEVENIQKDMAVMSQNQTILRIAKTFAKIQIKGLDFFNDILSRIKEEGFKMIIKEGINEFKETVTPTIEEISRWWHT